MPKCQGSDVPFPTMTYSGAGLKSQPGKTLSRLALAAVLKCMLEPMDGSKTEIVYIL